MKLVYKLTLLLSLGIVLLFGIHSALAIQREHQMFRLSRSKDAKLLADVIRRVLKQEQGLRNQTEVENLVKGLNGDLEGVGYDWTWLARIQEDWGLTAAEVDKLRAKENVVLRRDTHLLMLFPIDLEGLGKGVLKIKKSSLEESNYVRESIYRVIATTTLMLVLSIVFMSVTGIRVVGRPVSKLLAKTSQIGLGNLSQPLDFQGKDEFGELGRAIDLMCEKLDTSQRELAQKNQEQLQAITLLRHSERLSTVGKLAAGVAHELGTPLNIIAGRAKRIASGKLNPEKSQENGAIIARQTDRITNIVSQLVDFSRRGHCKKQVANLTESIEQILELLKPLARKKGVQFDFKKGAELKVAYDETQLQQVLTNIVMNAIHAMPEGGTVSVSTEQKLLAARDGSDREKEHFLVAIKDEGTGISKDNLSKIFDPFFTTKDVGEGTGLGLPVVHGILQDHNGWIEVDSVVGQGSCFTIVLPRETEYEG